MSWREAPGAMMVAYEDLTAAPAEVIRDILSFSGADPAAGDVEEAMARADAKDTSRLNVGVPGRGADLRPETIQTILDLIDLYPEAAADPDIRAVRAQAHATLAGIAARPLQIRCSIGPLKPAKVWRGLRKRDKRLLVQWVLPIALLVAGLSYWVWPNDLIPDHSAYGYLDDATVMLVSSFLAGVLRYKKV